MDIVISVLMMQDVPAMKSFIHIHTAIAIIIVAIIIITIQSSRHCDQFISAWPRLRVIFHALDIGGKEAGST